MWARARASGLNTQADQYWQACDWSLVTCWVRTAGASLTLLRLPGAIYGMQRNPGSMSGFGLLSTVEIRDA